MTELDIYHMDESNLSFAIDSKTVVIRLKVKKNINLKDVLIHYGVKYAIKKFKEKEMILKYKTESFKYYEVILNLTDRRLSYFFSFKLNNKQYYYTEDGFLDSIDFDDNEYTMFQIGYINDNDIHNEVSFAKSTVFYQIFPDRFYQGISDKDTSYINLKQGGIINRDCFYGGDLQGIIDKIPYLKELGINAIYLTPIFQSMTNHKYDTLDYYNVDKMFGNNDTLKELVTKLHENNIKIILDLVFNHVSYFNEMFIDAKEKGKDSKYFNYFVVHGDKIEDDDKSFNFDSFSMWKYMPKLNTSNKEVQEFLLGITKHYIENYDVDGYRLDVADEVCHDFWRKFRQECKSLKKDFYILGEVWPDAHSYLNGDQFDGVMNYPFRKAVIDYYMNHHDASKLASDLNNCLVSHTSMVNNMMYNLLDSHDSPRFLYQINDDVDLIKQAWSIDFMFVGIPSLFYGDEILLSGGHDPQCRIPMKFELNKVEQDMFNFMKNIISIRKNNLELQEGDINIYSKNKLFYIERSSIETNKKIVLVLNNTDKEVKINLNNKEVLLSNKLSNSFINNKGFVIYKE